MVVILTQGKSLHIVAVCSVMLFFAENIPRPWLGTFEAK
jgi:hypothetical protein